MKRTHRFQIGAIVAAVLVGAALPARAQSARPATEADALAIYRARLAEQQANNEANLAAASAGYRQALSDAKQGSLNDQLRMVGDAVRNWKVPRGYAGAAALDRAAIQDPFAAPEPASNIGEKLQLAMRGSGLVLNKVRLIARVGPDAAGLCDGRLQAGDYPALEDGNMLDTPARVAQFLVFCSDRTRPLVVVLESGDVAVRK